MQLILQTIKNIVLLPINLMLFILKYFAYKINKKDFEREKKKLELSYESNRILRAELDVIIKQNKILGKNRGRILSFLDRNVFYTKEMFNNNNEILIVYYNSNDIFHSISLLGESGNHPTNDSRINLSLHENNLKIDEFISNTKDKGYGRFLLKFLIEKAKNYNLEEIYGDLSPEDSSKFV